MNHRKPLAALAFAFGVTAGTAAFAVPVGHEFGPDLVTNGGFETGDFTGWNASVDPTYSGVDDVAAHTGNYGAYFGDFGTPGSISQSIVTVAGASYGIHFWLDSDGLSPNSVQLLWGGTTVYGATDLGQLGYTEIVLDAAATAGLTTLELRARNDNGFLEVDDISVRQLPEPAGLALLVPGLVGMAALRRRKR